MYPILFTIGEFNVYAFGFFLALAFLFSTYIVWKYAKDTLEEEEYLDAYLYTCLSALICSRIVFILLHFSDFGLNFLKYIVVRQSPGLSLLGGLLGGVIYLFIYTRKRKENFWKYLDLFSLSGCFALFLAKIGEQLGGGGFGRETSSFLGINIAGVPGRHHPVELYESILLFIVGIVLLCIYRKVKKNIWPQGLVSLIFGLSVAVIIFVLEFMKVNPIYLYNLSFRQIAAIIMIIVIGLPLIKKFKIMKGLKK